MAALDATISAIYARQGPRCAAGSRLLPPSAPFMHPFVHPTATATATAPTAPDFDIHGGRCLPREDAAVSAYAAEMLLALAAEAPPADEAAWLQHVRASLEGLESQSADDAAERVLAALDHAEQGRLKARVLAALRPPAAEAALAADAACMVRLDVDDDWHAAVVEGAGAAAGAYRVRVLQYGLVKELPRADIVLLADVAVDDDDDEEIGAGPCELCERVLPLTRHHLMPRSEHARLAKKIPRETLELTTAICRGCHNAVHHAETNTALASTYHTLDALRAHAAVARWVQYARGTTRLTPWDTAMMRNHAAQRRK